MGSNSEGHPLSKISNSLVSVLGRLAFSSFRLGDEGRERLFFFPPVDRWVTLWSTAGASESGWQDPLNLGVLEGSGAGLEEKSWE